jgi:hypothetical protein
VRQAEAEAKLARLTVDERHRLRVLERENRELRMSTDRLRNAATLFAKAALTHTPLWHALPVKRLSTAAPTKGDHQPDAAELLTAAIMTLYTASAKAEIEALLSVTSASADYTSGVSASDDSAPESAQ